MDIVSINQTISPLSQASSIAGASQHQSPAPQGQSPSNSARDRVSLSPEGRELSGKNDAQAIEDTDPKDNNSTQPNEKELTADDQRTLQTLRKRDAEVKAHEQAHLTTAGQYAAGGASYTYETGPDGRKYAVGGEVPIDVSKEATPEKTLQKMQIVGRAATAPANPSPADRQIASRAAMLAAEARGEIMEQSTSQANQTTETKDTPTSESEQLGVDSTSDTGKNESDFSVMSGSRQMVLNAYQAQLG